MHSILLLFVCCGCINHCILIQISLKFMFEGSKLESVHGSSITGEDLDAVTAVTDSFKMADAFAGDRTGDAVAQISALTVDISVRQGRVWVNRLQRMYGSGWWVILRAKSGIVDPRDAAVTARGWCSISLVKPNKDSVTTEIPAACNLWNRTLFFRARDSERYISKVPDDSDGCFPWSGEIISRFVLYLFSHMRD